MDINVKNMESKADFAESNPLYAIMMTQATLNSKCLYIPLNAFRKSPIWNWVMSCITNTKYNHIPSDIIKKNALKISAVVNNTVATLLYAFCIYPLCNK